jgi:hypothetical protein
LASTSGSATILDVPEWVHQEGRPHGASWEASTLLVALAVTGGHVDDDLEQPAEVRHRINLRLP